VTIIFENNTVLVHYTGPQKKLSLVNANRKKIDENKNDKKKIDEYITV
jgi:hypothetical protein